MTAAWRRAMTGAEDAALILMITAAVPLVIVVIGAPVALLAWGISALARLW